MPSPSEPSLKRELTTEQRAVVRNIWRDVFLGALHPEGYRYLAGFRKSTPDKETVNALPRDTTFIEKFARLCCERERGRELNVYFGVAPRVSLYGRDGKHCLALYGLFVDIDFKDTPEDDARKRLAVFPFPPSAVVATGGGLHVYWLLNAPLNLQNGGFSRAKGILLALASTLGGDESAAEPARVLRMPGTLNYKYEPPREVALEYVDQGRRYELDAILRALPPIPDDVEKSKKSVEHGLTIERRIQLAREWLEKQAPAVSGQSGDQRTYEVCCAVVIDHDLDVESALTALEDWNARCEPQWDENELRQKIRNAEAYGSGRRGSRLLKFLFITNDKGAILVNNPDNIVAGIRGLGLRPFQDVFSDRTWIASGAHTALVQNRPLFTGDGGAWPLDDAALSRIWVDFYRNHNFQPGIDKLNIMLDETAGHDPVHPVCDYLDSLAWDGVERLDRWLITYGGARDDEYTRAVGRLVLIAAVRRVRSPGCKFDEMLILESDQGLDKSTAIRTLCKDENWFTDSLPLGADAKVVIERTSGIWIVEASDFHGGNKKTVEDLKAMLSRQVDGPVRMAYARRETTRKRQFIIIGTSNDLQLHDPTGNRRFWPVRVSRFDLEALRRDRDQLWAEAAQREATKESIRLDARLWSKAGEEQEERRVDDPWKGLIEKALADPPAELKDVIRLKDKAGRIREGGVRVTDDELWDLLEVSKRDRNSAGASRLAAIMKGLGYKRAKVRRDTRTPMGWGRNPSQGELELENES